MSLTAQAHAVRMCMPMATLFALLNLNLVRIIRTIMILVFFAYSRRKQRHYVLLNTVH